MSEEVQEAVEQLTPAQKRSQKIAAEKEALRARISAVVNKVPDKVNAGGIQATREWVGDNEKAQVVAGGGRQRMSRRALTEMASKMEAWRQPA